MHSFSNLKLFSTLWDVTISLFKIHNREQILQGMGILTLLRSENMKHRIWIFIQLFNNQIFVQIEMLNILKVQSIYSFHNTLRKPSTGHTSFRSIDHHNYGWNAFPSKRRTFSLCQGISRPNLNTVTARQKMPSTKSDRCASLRINKSCWCVGFFF